MENYSNQALKQFRDETEPHAQELADYDRMLQDKARELRARKPSIWRSAAWPLLPIGVAAAAAAVALFVVPGEPAVSVDAPLHAAMVSPEAPSTIQATEHVSIEYQGDAQLSGTVEAPVVELSSGHVLVSVTPDQGIDLRVRTPDGEVRVLGTVFEVNRDDLGTHVSVKRGKVGVFCEDGSHQTLTKGQIKECAPNSAAGMLTRADALAEAGASHEQVLQAANRGLEMQPNDAERAQLLHSRMTSNVGLKDYDAGLADALAYLASGEQARRVSALQTAAQLSTAVDGDLAVKCEAARPHLEELVELDQVGPVAKIVERCQD